MSQILGVITFLPDATKSHGLRMPSIHHNKTIPFYVDSSYHSFKFSEFSSFGFECLSDGFADVGRDNVLTTFWQPFDNSILRTILSKFWFWVFVRWFCRCWAKIVLGRDNFLTTFWQLFDNFFFFNFLTNFLSTFWQTFWQLFDKFLTNFWKLFYNFGKLVDNFLIVLLNCGNKYYGIQ
jgi:hypothetical protein